MDIRKTFGIPQPLTDKQVERLGKLQEAFLKMAETIVENTTNAPERELALESLHRSMIFAQAATQWYRSVITPSLVADWFSKIEAGDWRVVRLWMNAYDFADVRKWGRDEGGFDPNNQLILRQQGIEGTLFSAEVRTSKSIPQGYVVLISDDQGDADLQPGWTPAKADLTEIC